MQAFDRIHSALNVGGAAGKPKLLLQQQDVMQEKIDEAVKSIYTKLDGTLVSALKINSSQPKPAKPMNTPRSARTSAKRGSLPAKSGRGE